MFSFGIIFKSESVTRNAVSKIHGIENHLVVAMMRITMAVMMKMASVENDNDKEEEKEEDDNKDKEEEDKGLLTI